MPRAIFLLKKHGYTICMAVLFCAAFFLRAYRLGSLPDVLHVDEAGLGCNAWCLARYGVDRYLNRWPVYPQNYGYGGQSPLYTYSVALLLKLFPQEGLTVALLRIPALLFGMLTVFCSAALLRLLFANKALSLAGTAFVTFCPYFIMASRYGLDCNMMLGATALALTLLFYYLKKPGLAALLLCGGGFALILYAYALSYLVVPVFLLLLAPYLLYTRQITLRRLFLLAGELALLALPLICFVLVLVFDLPGFRFLGMEILPVGAERMSDFSPSGFFYHFLRCIRISLTENGYYMDAPAKYYTLYPISIPFIALGFFKAAADFVRSLRQKRFAPGTVFLLYALCVLSAVSLSGGSGLVHRANAVFICYLYFWLTGLRLFLRLAGRMRKYALSAAFVAYAGFSAAFCVYYFNDYSVADSYRYPNSYYFVPEEGPLNYALEAGADKEVYLDCFFEEYFLFYQPRPPYAPDRLPDGAAASRLFVRTDQNTPIHASSLYIIRRENAAFIEHLRQAGIPYTTKEYDYYYVFETSASL